MVRSEIEERTCTQGEKFKLCWHFEYKMKKTSTAHKPDMTLEDVREKRIWIVDMSCPQEKNIEEVNRTKMQQYQQLTFETREKRPGYAVEVVPVIIGCLGGSVENTGKVVAKIDRRKKEGDKNIEENTIIYLEVETNIRKVLNGKNTIGVNFGQRPNNYW